MELLNFGENIYLIWKYFEQYQYFLEQLFWHYYDYTLPQLYQTKYDLTMTQLNEYPQKNN